MLLMAQEISCKGLPFKSLFAIPAEGLPQRFSLFGNREVFFLSSNLLFSFFVSNSRQPAELGHLVLIVTPHRPHSGDATKTVTQFATRVDCTGNSTR